MLTLHDPHHSLVAYLIFLASYLVFAIGRFPGTRIDRSAAAVIGAALMFGFRVLSSEQGLHSIDYATIVLLFAMMVVVAGLHLAGFFEWVTDIFLAHVKPGSLLPIVIFTSGILSAFLVNDIVCLLMAPLVLQVARHLSRRVTPYLLALATASNIGSTATITGNPQNILIGSISRISYLNFIAHLGPLAIIGLFLDWGVLYWIYFRSAPGLLSPPPEPAFTRQQSHLVFPGLVTLAVLAGFLLGLPPALVAAIGAAILLVHPRYRSQFVYEEIDWSLLVFFIGLFVIVGGAREAG
ncbi:MAG TPA: SLC13 family permease, partial [Terriglobales bacterium]|nr:SLC13 family permease [Terriglobales bacterium]